MKRRLYFSEINLKPMLSTKMHFNTFFFISISFVLLFLSSCGKDTIMISEQEEELEIPVEEIEFNEETLLFQMEYINFAWVSQHYGWYVIDQGEVRAYSNVPEWQIADASGYFDLDALKQNYVQANRIIAHIDIVELKRKLA
ncbi:MAG: hypothetical protein AAGA77_00065 [Bacteroidota bacterium]